MLYPTENMKSSKKNMHQCRKKNAYQGLSKRRKIFQLPTTSLISRVAPQMQFGHTMLSCKSSPLELFVMPVFCAGDTEKSQRGAGRANAAQHCVMKAEAITN
ncbi:unnamed protein product [Caenorhabditis auriculariae]|uniref:Uncharacterized protein n=1 Tax=Caenorhabditis auriculariae TaxID=2777116 RepID=A0A8S1H5G6_9PELO|nr:unnamed protein product [Caenorhabditis auriculariae]